MRMMVPTYDAVVRITIQAWGTDGLGMTWLENDTFWQAYPELVLQEKQRVTRIHSGPILNVQVNVKFVF